MKDRNKITKKDMSSIIEDSYSIIDDIYKSSEILKKTDKTIKDDCININGIKVPKKLIQLNPNPVKLSIGDLDDGTDPVHKNTMVYFRTIENFLYEKVKDTFEFKVYLFVNEGHYGIVDRSDTYCDVTLIKKCFYNTDEELVFNCDWINIFNKDTNKISVESNFNFNTSLEYFTGKINNKNPSFYFDEVDVGLWDEMNKALNTLKDFL